MPTWLPLFPPLHSILCLPSSLHVPTRWCLFQPTCAPLSLDFVVSRNRCIICLCFIRATLVASLGSFVRLFIHSFSPLYSLLSLNGSIRLQPLVLHGNQLITLSAWNSLSHGRYRFVNHHRCFRGTTNNNHASSVHGSE